MDIWVVVAAAGAGYVAQHWKDFTRRGQSMSDSSSGKRQAQDKTCPFRRMGRKKNLSKDVSEERESLLQGEPREALASTSGFDGEKVVAIGNNSDQEHIRLSGALDESFGDLLLKPSNRETGSSYGRMVNSSILRSRRNRSRFMKRLSCRECCLTAQLYQEHAEMEEYTFGSIPLPSMQSTRPFLVTDGSRIISRASGNSFNVQNIAEKNMLLKGTDSEENETVIGVPPLTKIRSLEMLKKLEVKDGRQQNRRLSSSGKFVNKKNSISAGGSFQGAVFFCLGISVGILSSFLTNKRAVHKVNELLKQTKNLVQDLQEELEMKDSLTVKELAIEDHETQDKINGSYSVEAADAFFVGQNSDETTYDCGESHHPKAEEEYFTNIEAELEAELERLEVNMNSSSLDRKMSNLVEFDPEFVPDIVQGELRADMFGEERGTQAYADRDGSGSSTTHSAYYAVSPRELSLRLHEVLQLRLEEHVKELETALQKVQCVKRHTESWREFSNGESGSSSIQGSPIAKEEQSFADEPVVINLSGEALDTYNEAYNEFSKINESEEDDLPSEIRYNDQQESLNLLVQNLYSTPHHSTANGNGMMAFVRQKEGDHNMSSYDISTSGDEQDHGEDEMENLLIKQILEKMRKGSPVVLNAQRALFEMDENET
ncbi:hypothetical protein RJ640_013830 [Escallonia rubra]|uniref:Uncharacterized protein n=1 Tax=Escallonia rubra TaxID=112253 RepID=A0AA88SID8_9ASTE|nr:hypothetical protein RJ640_013830 [Escallonia rubra]